MEHNYSVRIADIVLRFISDIPLVITDEIQPHLVYSACDQMPHVDILIRWCRYSLPEEVSVYGQDLLIRYYQSDEHAYAVSRKQALGDCAVCVYRKDFSEVILYINERKYPGMIRRISKVLQLLPMRQLLTYFRTLMLHSSRILIDGKALLFSAPSGTGKTTQAKLWKKYEGAEILSNDRTLLKEQDGIIFTDSYPVDGDEPIERSVRSPLGAIVILRQSDENTIFRLSNFKAIKYLMEETIADAWNMKQLNEIKMLWLDLLERISVYMLECRPDQEAVNLLNDRLKKDGVISDETKRQAA